MFLNARYTDILNLNKFVIKYTKYIINSNDKVSKIYFLN